MVSTTMEDIEINVDDASEHQIHHTLSKRRKIDNGNSMSDKDECELQVVDDEIDVSGADSPSKRTEQAFPFIEEVMDEGGGDQLLLPPTQDETMLRSDTGAVTVVVSSQETTMSASVVLSTTDLDCTLLKLSPPSSSFHRVVPGPPNVTALSALTPSVSSVGLSSNMASSNITSASTPHIMPPSMVLPIVSNISSHCISNPANLPHMVQSNMTNMLAANMHHIMPSGMPNMMISTMPNMIPATMPSMNSLSMPNRTQHNTPNMVPSGILMPTSIPSASSTVSNPLLQGDTGDRSLISDNSSTDHPEKQVGSPSATSVSNMNLMNSSAVVQSIMSSVSATGPSVNSDIGFNNIISTSNMAANNSSVSNLPMLNTNNPVGVTAHALLETLLAQVIAHSMNGSSGGSGVGAETGTTPVGTLMGTPVPPQTEGEAAPLSDVIPPLPSNSAPFTPPNEMGAGESTVMEQCNNNATMQQCSVTEPMQIQDTVQGNLQDTFQEPLQETLDKINILEQNTASLDKQTAGIKKMVTEVVKKQEENSTAAGTICPRCKKMVGGGQQFISHLIAVHNFVEQTGPVSKADFASQAGLGTCRGWRYIRTKNSGSQTTLSVVGKGEKKVIDLTDNNSNISPLLVDTQKPVVPKPSPSQINSVGEHQIKASPVRPTALSPRGAGYDSARATAAGLLSFVFGNPDINKQFTDFADLPKEGAVNRSPKKQFPTNYAQMPFLQTINKQMQQHNGLALFDRMKDVKPISPIMANAQQKELMAHAMKQQHHHMQAQHQIQQQMQQQMQQAAALQAAQAQRAALHGPPQGIRPPIQSTLQNSLAPIQSSIQPPTQSSMQPIQPIQPTPIQASSLQQIRPHGSNFSMPAAMISAGDMKDYQNAISGQNKSNAFDESSDSPLKDCIPKVRASLVNGDIQLMWNIIGDERKCTGYRLFAYMGNTAPPISSAWTEVGTVKALPMPMAVTLSQFSKGCAYHFTVRAIDSKGNLGPFSEPCSIKLSL